MIELARQRLAPVHFNQAIVSATMYGPQEAVTAGFSMRSPGIFDGLASLGLSI